MTSEAQIVITAKGLTRAQWDALLADIQARVAANRFTIITLALDSAQSFYTENP